MSRRLALTALLVGAIPSVVVATTPQDTPSQKAGRGDPAADMGAEQQIADHERVWAAYLRQYETWLADLNASVPDFTEMERVELMALVEPPRSSLAEAVRDADAIVVATVDQVEFRPSLTAVVHLKIEQSIKGPASSELTILMSGGPQPHDSSWDEVVLAESLSAPLLLPGDRAILLLDWDGRQYSVQAHTGELKITSEGVMALDSNPGLAVVDGKELDAVLDLLVQLK